MQLGTLKLESGTQQRRALGTGDLVQERAGEQSQARDVDPIARSEQNVIVGLGAIVEIEHDRSLSARAPIIFSAGVRATLARRGSSHPAAAGLRQRRVNASRAVSGRWRTKPAARPASSAETVRPRKARSARAARGAPRAVGLRIGRIAEPVDGAAGEDFGIGAGLGQKRGGFARALPPPITATRLPRNIVRSVCSQVWLTNGPCRSPNGCGRYSWLRSPVAMTTRSAVRSRRRQASGESRWPWHR